MTEQVSRVRQKVGQVNQWYKRFESRISSLFLLGGFIIDSFTLQRVDMVFENVWVLGHFIILSTAIFLHNKIPQMEGDEENPEKIHFWLVNVMQFFFGGLLSVFTIFYFRSTTLSVTWPFLLILVAACIANEKLKKHYARLTFQLSFFYFLLFVFSIFIIPVITHRIGPLIFLLSGAVSLGLQGFFFWIIARFSRERFASHKNVLLAWIGVIFLGINILYFARLIPPIPLSIKDAGIYHLIQKTPSGAYEVWGEPKNWTSFFKRSEEFRIKAGSVAYAYTAIFSPSNLDLNIVHEWQKYDQVRNQWVTHSVIDLSVVGGRSEGYRTYSWSSVTVSGDWRVNVKTVSGQVIGRLNFTATDEEPKRLETDIKL